MANSENPDDETAPWTIKGMKVSARKQAIARSGQEGLSVAAYMDRLIQRDVRESAGDRILPPMVPDRAPVLVPASGPPVDLQQAAAMLSVLSDASKAPDLSKAAMREATALFRQHVRQARGLPALAQRKTNQPQRANQRMIEGGKE